MNRPFEKSAVEFEPKLNVVVREATSAEEVIPARHMQAASWRATYPNEEAGVSEEWVNARTSAWLHPDRLKQSIEILDGIIKDPTQFYRIAEANGEVIGFIHLTTKEDSSKYLEALYTSPNTFGAGVGAKLMQAADEWIGGNTATLEVATYNQRARRFYEKHGFHEIPGSDHFYAETMPTIYMIREGEAQ
jgi:ribosomal protein S18 acetylase RimI-like enzyme